MRQFSPFGSTLRPSFLLSAAIIVSSLNSATNAQFSDHPGGQDATAHALAAEEEGMILRVLSFNIRYGTASDGVNRWENRHEFVADVIKSSNADLIGLQEALRFQIDQLVKDIPDYQFVGLGRDDGKDQGEFSAILYNVGRFEPIDTETFWFSDTPGVAGSMSWGNTLPRICTYARFRDRDSGEFVDIYNLHLDHRSAPSRERSTALLWERIRRRSSDRTPIVVTGDFNASEESAPILFLKGEQPGPNGQSPPQPGLIDSYRIIQPEETEVRTAHGFRGGVDGPKIDYVLVHPHQSEVTDAEIIRVNRAGRYPSDHYPVSATLVLRPAQLSD